MNHNPHNLKVGDTAILDKKEGEPDAEVTIKQFTPFCTQSLVGWYGNDDYWWVMTNRLTPITA